jgi:hypothetical protein
MDKPANPNMILVDFSGLQLMGELEQFTDREV